MLGTIELPGADRPRNRRHLVFVLVETLDLATVKALRYAHEVRPDEIRAVHFAIDEAHARRARGGLGGDGRDHGAAGAGGVPRPAAAARHGGTGRAHHRGRRDLADGPGPPAHSTATRWASCCTGAPPRRWRRPWSTCRSVAVTILPFDVSRALHALAAGRTRPNRTDPTRPGATHPPGLREARLPCRVIGRPRPLHVVHPHPSSGPAPHTCSAASRPSGVSE